MSNPDLDQLAAALEFATDRYRVRPDDPDARDAYHQASTRLRTARWLDRGGRATATTPTTTQED